MISPPATSRPIAVMLEAPDDAAEIERLVLAAFGPGRFAKTAERLREGSRPSFGLVAREAGHLIGSVRLWPIRIGETPALFLGPIAVEAGSRGGGLGADLVAGCVDHAIQVRTAGILLVGEPPYFQRFGFSRLSGADLPGPVDPRRVMWRSTDARPAPVGQVRSL